MLVKKTALILILFGFIFSMNSPCFSQNKRKAHDYKFLDWYAEESEITDKILVTNYEFKGIPVTTIEQYYRNSDDQEIGLRETVSKWSGCANKTDLADKNGKAVGKKYVCDTKISGKKAYIIGYTYFDNLNKAIYIIGKSKKIVERFAKGICPLALQLYNDKRCPEF